MPPPRYPSDLFDAEWAILEPLLSSAEKRGRPRHILVDTNGLVLAARVHGGDLPDRDGGRRLLEEGKGLSKMELLWGDGAYTGEFCE